MATTTDYFLQGFQQGANVTSEGLRLQELKSQAALRRMQEARAAQEMQMLVAENDRQIQYRADMTKSVQAAQFAASPTVHLPGMGVVPNPNPMTQPEAALKFILPTVAKHDPAKVPNVMQDIAMSEFRSRDEDRDRQLTEARIKNLQGVPESERAATAKSFGLVPSGIDDQGRANFARPYSNQIETNFTPATKVITDELGNKITVLQERENGPWKRVPESASARQQQGFNNEQKMSVFKFALAKAPHLMKQDENGMPFLPPENFAEAARLSKITPATQTALQGVETASDDVFALGRKLFPLINDKTTSLGENVRRLVRDSPWAVILPDDFIPSAESTEADAVARNFMSGIVRSLRSDGNITGPEAQSLQDEANTVRWTDEKTGKTRVKTFVQLGVRKARDASLRLGVPINEKYLTFDEIAERAEAQREAGKMTPEQAMEWAVKTYDNSAEAMIRDFNEQIKRLERPNGR